MGGTQRRRKNSRDTPVEPEATTSSSSPTIASAKMDVDAADRLENILIDFWNGLKPWTQESHDRSAAVAALLEGRAAVLSLDDSSNATLASVFGKGATLGMSGNRVQEGSGNQNDDSTEDAATNAINSPPTMKNSVAEVEATGSAPKTTGDETQQKEPFNGPSEYFGYWMFLGSHILSRLMIECSKELLSQSEDNTAENNDLVSQSYRRVLCYLCHGLSCALFGHQQPRSSDVNSSSGNMSSENWEKASTGAARHWLARLVTTLTAATAGHGLSPFTSSRTTATSTTSTSKGRGTAAKSDSSKVSPLSLSALAAATLCLERLLVTGGSTSSNSTNAGSSSISDHISAKSYNHWRRIILPIVQQLATDGVDADLAQSCHRAFASVTGDWSRERACLNALQSQSVVVGLHDIFADILREHPPYRIEGRIAYRRWAPIVLEWYSQAPFAMFQQARALLKSSDVAVDHPSIPLAVLARWLSLMVEWSSRCGTRAPTGSLDQYLKQISLGRKKTKGPDLRESVLAVLYRSIEYHAVTLAAVPFDENTLGRRGMINDQDWDCAAEGAEGKDSCDTEAKESTIMIAPEETITESRAVGRYYPFMTQLLSDLARIAGVSDSLPYSADHFENLAGAIVLQQHISRDTNLLYWTLKQVVALIGQMDGSSGNYDHLLAHPLIAASTGKPSACVLVHSSLGNRKRKVGNDATAGPNNPRSAIYDRFALFLRAMHGKYTASQIKKNSQVAFQDIGHSFVDYLLSVIESCLDTRTISSTGVALALSDPLLEVQDSKKRKVVVAQSPNATRRSKRRKKEDTEDSAKMDMEDSTSGLTFGEFQPISPGRSKLASVALDLLQQIWAGDEDRLIGQRFTPLGSEVIGTPELFRIVHLGEVLDTVLLRTRCWDKVAEDTSKAGGALHCPAPSLTPEEKSLWESHMNFSVTAARGKSFLASKTALTGRRLEVFKLISMTSKALSMDRGGTDAWPLWLPTSHWLLVASNIAGEKEAVEVEADRFIVDGVLGSIKFVLSQLEMLLSLIPTTERATYVDPEIPLSLQDVQLYLGALVRLPSDQRVNVVAALTKEVCSSFQTIQKDAACVDLLKNNRVVSGFCARLVTTCTYAAVFAKCEESVRDQVLQMLNCVSIGSPSLWLAREGYHLQGHFMGVFSDRESSLLPQMTELPDALNSESAMHLRHLLEVAFEVGLLAAPEDHGFLMFSAWNALGKAPVWEPSVQSALLTSIPDDSIGSVLLALRENVCFIYQQIQAVDGKIPSTTISMAYSNKLESSANSPTLAENLRLLIESGSSMIEFLLDQQDHDDDQRLLSGEEFALMEALCVALSFAVSSITKPKKNYVEDLVSNLESKRPRSYSTESEAAGSDGESGATEEARVEAFERIEICVSRMGGALAHPDWLDTNCSLRYGVSMDEAQRLALMALEILSRTVSRAKSGQHKSGVASLEATDQIGNSPRFSDLVVRLLGFTSWFESMGSGSSDVKEIARLCNAEPTVVQCIAERSACLPSVSALATWCSNSAQRILGHFHVLFRNQMIDISELGLGEMRVGEEWEVGLSFALTSACAGFAGTERKEGLTDHLCNTLISCNRWERLATTALSCLVPVSALVRYTAYRMGRNQHPFSKLTCNDDYQFVKTYLPERMPSFASVNPKLKSIVQSAVQTITSASICNEPTAELIAANLFADPLAFLKLRSAASVKSALETLAGVVEACNAQASDSGFLVVVEHLVLSLVQRDHNDTERTSGIVKFFVTRNMHPSEEGSDLIGGGSPQVHFRSQQGSHLASTLIAFLWECPSLSENPFRDLIMVELGNLAVMEMRNVGTNEIASFMVDWLTKLSQDHLFKILETDVIKASDQASASLCVVLASALLSNRRDRDCGFESALFEVLMGLVRDDSFRSRSSQKPKTKWSAVLNLLFLYGTYCKKLVTISALFLENVSGHLKSIEVFVAFLRDLHNCLHNNSVKEILAERETDSYDTVPGSCSFALKGGFYEQHWYNCKTCGLVDEKGCCSLCVLVCHQGHDVSYARFSSFFCDCGAQNGHEGFGTFCRCLSPLTKYECVQAHLVGANRDELEEQRKSPDVQASKMESFDYASIAARAFHLQALDSLDFAIRHITHAELNREVELVLEDRLWASKKDGPPFPSKQGLAVSLDDIRLRMLRSPRTKSSVLQVDSSLSRATVSTRNSLNMGISIDSSMERSLRAKLLEQVSDRSVMAADSRGRLLVAETGQITLIGGGSIPGEEALEGAALERRTLPIIGTKTLPLKSINGISFNSDSEKHILAWGAADACVVILNADATFGEGHFDLEFGDGIHAGDSDSIVKGQWLPSSEAHVSIGSVSAIHFFSFCSCSTLAETDPPKILPDLAISINPTFTMKDYCLVPIESHGSNTEGAWRVFAVLNDGSLHSAVVNTGVSGLLTSPSSSIGFDVPYVFKSLDEDRNTIDGQITRMDYLRQSSILVCQASAGSVVALVLDKAGCVRRHFEIIPESVIVSDQLVNGPFSHFTELGLTKHKDDDFFHVVCVAPLVNRKGHVVLSVAFNDNPQVRIGKVGTLEGEGLIDGATALSVPCAENDDDEMNLSGYKTFVEKVLLCVVESDGRLSLFCEGGSRVLDERLVSFSRRVTLSTYPVLAFEKLMSMSSSKILCHVNGCSSSDISSKLQRDSESFFLSPRRDGFTLSIVPLHGQDSKGPVVAALRLLVGKTSSSCVPQQVFIGGRPVKLQVGVKKWYSFIFTADEIALALRNGFVTVTFTQPMDSTNNPILDAMDVYCIDRNLCSWIPQRLGCLNGPETVPGTWTLTRPENGLLSAANTLTSLCCILRPSCFTWRTQVVSDLIAQTCLASPDVATAVEGLVRLTEPETGQQLLDRARLVACVGFLSKCPNESEGGLDKHPKGLKGFWRENRHVLQDCLELASGIARQRPMNYTPSLDGNTKCSIASLASVPVTQCLSFTLDYDELVGTFVEVCLLEMAVAGSIGYDQNKQGSMGNFAPLRTLLTQQSGAIVKASCDSIARFCKKYSSPKLLYDDFDFFHSSRIMTFACDCCQLTPIRGVRYTLLDDHHPFDLCNRCHELGMEFASNHSFSETIEVSIDGRKVGDPKLTCAEVGRMHSVLMQDHPSGGTGRQQLYDVFLDGLFNGLVALIAGPDKDDKSAPVHLIRLVVGLVDLADNKRRVERKKRIAKELCNGVSLALGIMRPSNSAKIIVDRLNQTLERYLSSLCQLIVSDDNARDYLNGKKPSTTAVLDDHKRTKTASCSTHGGQPMCKKAIDGIEKFYVCSQEKCNFFVWANDHDSRKTGSTSVSEYDSEAAKHVWKLLTSCMQPEAASLNSRICDFLETGFVGLDRSLAHRSVFTSPRTFEEAYRDVLDGVLCSKERLFLYRTDYEFVAKTSLLPLTHPLCRDSWGALIESCLELLCLAAGPDTGEGVTAWFPVLCTLLMEENPPVRSLAKTAVFRLCGRDSDLYFVVRDHHAFGIQLKKVLLLAWPLMIQAAVLKEKARQCSTNWKGKPAFTWENGSGFEFVGFHLLVAEDSLTLSSHECIRKQLNEILSSAKKRVMNWKRFCRLKSIQSSGDRLLPSPEESALFCLPPLRALLYLSSILPPDCQARVMKLIDLGIPHASETRTKMDLFARGTRSAVLDFVEPKSALHDKPLDALILSHKELCDFSVHFVLRGGRSELRRSAGSVAAKLCSYVEAHVVGNVVRSLTYGSLGEVGEMGRGGLEFVALLSNIIGAATWPKGTIKAMAEFVETSWREQLLGVRHDRSNNEYLFFDALQGQTIQKKRFDLAPCFYCHIASQPSIAGSRRSEGRLLRNSSSKADAEPSRPSTSKSVLGSLDSSAQKTWLSNQVSPFTTGRLESIRDAHASSEFASFFTLKYRLALSEISVDVHELRGRFVKTIKVYGSAGFVENVSELKSGHKWQEVATLSLSQGGARASCSLEKPFLAANLKIEYCDFYERPGGSRAADGTLLIHCPRCARVVSNAHGVCGNCGEVAFQCRKCRHINYDRLDAFLCVECGYCASGSFVFEINAGIASNASAILNEEDYRRSQRQLELSTRIYDDVLKCFRDQYSLAVRVSNVSMDAAIKLPSEGLRLAYASDTQIEYEQGAFDLTPEAVAKQGSIVKAVARPGTASILSSETMDHYRSVLLLARSSPAMAGSSRRRSRDIIIRHVGRDLQVDDEESDLIGLLESTDGLARVSGLDPTDPLSRLLASVQSRREQNQESRIRREKASEPSRINSKSAKVIYDVCDKLNMLLREAEREIYQLKRRIGAWHYLQKGHNVESASAEAGLVPLIPSHCWTCAGSLAGHLLVLWLRLFQADPDSVPMTESTVRLLLQEDNVAPKSLLECKRLAVSEVALKSERGASLIEDVLRLRLRASQDINAAEILGQIISSTNGIPCLREKFITLAKEQLGASYRT